MIKYWASPDELASHGFDNQVYLMDNNLYGVECTVMQPDGSAGPTPAPAHRPDDADNTDVHKHVTVS